jgi:uncharacterized membrane protein YraQ (UPF0718 family)/YHS domain-containing protein
VGEVASQILRGLENALLMAWDVWWALVLGFAVSAIVQAWVPRGRIESAMSGAGARPVGVATVLGAASSSCSYAAVAIAKSLFQKGASAASAMAFQFASTNLVWELGLVLWVLIGWQFTAAEYLGGLLMIGLMTLFIRAVVSPSLERQAREHALAADTGHQHNMAGDAMPLRRRLTSASAWSDVAHNFRGDWQMLWKEISIGFLLAGFIGLLGNGFFNSLFLTSAPAPFIFADLLVLPILAIYRKYYGMAFTIRISALMFVTMVIAALAIDGLFTLAGVVPDTRPGRGEIFAPITVDYKFVLNVIATVAFAGLFALTIRRGATDPVCGMQVDRAKGLRAEHAGRTFVFCSEHCLHRFQADPERYAGGRGAGGPHEHAHAH